MKTQLRITVMLALWLAAGTVRGQVVTASLSVTFPAKPGYFGSAVAAVGSDKVIIAAPNASEMPGAAYLFSTNGSLITTFTNPIPMNYDDFGSAVAAVGLDKVLIGAQRDDAGGNIAFDSGAAYLFGTNGALLTTLTNPAPGQSDLFGRVITAVGTNKVLVGVPSDDTVAVNVGSAYLFSTDGTLLVTFTNPSPSGSSFGSSVTAFGPDKVLIGSSLNSGGGAAYLFNTDGTLVTTFTNPSPASGDVFGSAVAALGADRVIIGASGDDIGAVDSGAAYLFKTNGTLLTTFTNPTPALNDLFGSAVAAVGLDKVLIGGAFDDNTGPRDSGTAYLFSTNGTLLTTISNPTPTFREQFGFALAAVTPDKIIIGSTFRAYLYSLVSPAELRLGMQRQPGGDLNLYWPLPATGFVLEQTTAFATPPATNAWSQVPFPYQTNATQISVTMTPATNQFFRLRQP